jgi:hypothetical protein
MKRLFLFLVIALFGVGSFGGIVKAASAAIYVSPGTSYVNKGSNVTVKVKVDAGSGSMDSVRATLNFDSSRLQYVGYSEGAFNTLTANPSDGSFRYSAICIACRKQGIQVVFSITFKALRTGAAALTLSDVAVSYTGAGFSSVSTSNGTVQVTTPGNASGSNNSTGEAQSSVFGATDGQDADSKAPKINGDIKIEKSQSTITLSFKSSEKAKSRTAYSLGDNSGFAVNNKLLADHKIVLGQKQPLEAGQTYQITIRLTDKDGNTAKAKSLEVRTTGVDYAVRIIDKDGQPLINHPVTLHSEPMQTMTDHGGTARFTDVTPGEHTLVLSINGSEITEPVTVAKPASGGTTAGEGSTQEIRLPISLTTGNTYLPSAVTRNNWLLVIVALLFCAAVMVLVKPKLLKRTTKKSSGKGKNSRALHDPKVIKPGK